MRLCSAAALILATSLLGCGGDDDGGTAADASPGADAARPDAAVGEVVLTATLDGSPVEGAEVFFSHPDGTLAARGVTDADGAFAAEVEAGSSATAIVDTFAGYRVVHITGVEPGDQLRAVIDENGVVNDPAGNVTIELPGTFDGATLYTLQAGCGTWLFDFEDGSHLLPIPPPCDDDIRVLAYARDNANNLFAFSSGSAAMLGATVILPAWRTDWDTIDLTTKNGNPDAPVYYLVGPEAGGGFFSGPEQFAATADGEGASAHTVELAAGFFDTVTLDVQAPQQTWFAHSMRRFADPPAAEAVDLAADFLPPITSLAVDADGFTWSAPAGVDAGDGVRLFAQWGEEPDQITLEVVAPASARSVALPEAPGDLPVVPFPAPGATAYYDLVDADVIDGYSEFRASNALRALLPATGDYAVHITASGGD